MKIRIANEEVLASNDFTINQEMLNTPSVILNNVYPKSWEVDKDYTSRFYHPDDYSQCQIVEEHEAEEGQTAEGTSFTITADNTKLCEITHLKGQTTQNGTPTPDTPIPIETTTGNQEIVVCGKNLFKVKTPDYLGNNAFIYYGGNNYTLNDDGFQFNARYSAVAFAFNNLQIGQKYTMSFDCVANVSTTFDIGVNCYNGSTDSNKGSKSVQASTTSTRNYYTFTAIATNRVAFNSGTNSSLTNLTISNIQLEKNNEPTSYEPYTSITKEINLGKNLLGLSFSNSYQGRGFNFENSVMTYYGNGNLSYTSDKYNLNIPNGSNVAMSLNYDSGTLNSGLITFRISFYDSSDTLITTLSANDIGTSAYTTKITRTGTLNQSASYIKVYVQSYQTDLTGDLKFKCQLELGEATTYSPYFTPIELCKIGDYQDSIIKDDGVQIIPNEYQQVEYIQSTGTQYIDTGISPTTNTGVKIKASLTTENNADKILIGSRVYSNRFWIDFDGTSSNNKIYCGYGNIYNAGNYTLNTDYEISFNYNGTKKIIVNNTSYDISGTYNSTGSVPIYIFRANYSSSYAGSFKIYYCQIYEGTTKLRDFIPCYRKSDNEIGLYDLVNGVFYTNSGTGTFICGKSIGKWNLEKQINKVVLDGSENWKNSSGWSKTNTNVFYYDTNNDIKYTSLSIVNWMSNNFIGMSRNGLYDADTNGIGLSGGVGNPVVSWTIRIDKTLGSDTANFKTWLNTHNTIVYYVLATPTYTEIANETLINELESLELLYGINNISVNGYLPGILGIHYNYYPYYEDLIFCGVVKNSGNISLNPRFPHYSTLQILDYKTFLSEGETLDFVIANKTILEAINEVIARISDYGFELGNVSILNSNEVIGAYSTKDKTAYDAFNYIADITQSRWTTRVLGVGRVAIDFYDPSLMPQGTGIEYNDTWFCQNKIIDMTYNYGTWNYRNKQVMTSNQVFGSIEQTQTIIYDGYANQLMTELPIGTISSITVDGVSTIIATNNDKAIGITADFYYTPGNNYFEKSMGISVGSQIVITYYPLVEGRQIVNNGVEIDRVSQATGTIGKISRYENRNDATTSLELQKIGQSYIKYKGTPEIKLTIKSKNNVWNVGDRVYFNAPITELKTDYMVRSKKTNYIYTANTIFYTFELISSFNSENEVNYFDNQRAKANGNIKEGQYISRNIDIEGQANIIFYDTEIDEVVANNTLQSELEIVLGG